MAWDARQELVTGTDSHSGREGALVADRRRGYQQAIMHRPIRILGIDPGLRRTGWGVVEIDGNRLIFLACGSVATNDKAALAERLVAIHDGLQRVVDEYAPDEAAVEATFVNKDAAATLKLGQARGIAMLVPAIAGLPVAEYAPNLVKKTIVGAGHGEKAQIRMMIGVLLPKADPQDRRRRRRARDRGLPRASPAERGAEGGSAAMIGKLKGIIDSYGEDFVILDVGGVGYQVHCSARTLQALPAQRRSRRRSSIETYVREDQIKLFGFLTDVEREWFRLLQTVQGVGAKVALSVLGTLKPAELASAIAMRDKAMVARTPGVGPKVAERIVTELKDKAPAYADLDPAVVRLSGASRRSARRSRSPTRSRRWSISATASRRRPPRSRPPRAAPARARTPRRLIRLGLKELARK